MAKTTAKTRHPLAQAPLDELAAELARRKAGLPKLLQRRDRLRAELEQLDAQITMLEGLDHSTGRTASGGGRKKKPGTGRSASNAGRRASGGRPTLREKIGEVLGTDPMRPVEIARALVDRGLHEGSKSLHIQVATTLAKCDDFAKVARGQWIRSDGKK